MVHFHCSVSWSKIKRVKDKYFQWLHQSKIYLNMTKFKRSTLAVCRFLVGAHPGHLRREDAEAEYRKRLDLADDFPFQLTARTVSVPMSSEKNAERYSFPAVVVETSTRQAKVLRETFFGLPSPAVAIASCQFVPMLQSKEWPHQKIFQLAKVHVKLCQNYKVIYIQNIQGIRNIVGERGHDLIRGFLGMSYTKSCGQKMQLIHSIHNTGRKNIKAVLVHQEHYDLAIDQFGALHQCLLAGIKPEYHKSVFIGDLEVCMTGAQRDTIHSCNSSQQATELLNLYNPQDGEEDSHPSNQKRFRPVVLSYASAISSNSVSMVSAAASAPSSAQPSSPISLTDSDQDKLYERLKDRVVGSGNTKTGISAEELETIVRTSNENITQVRQEMKESVAHLSSQVVSINLSVKKQNTVVAGLHMTM